MITDKHLRLVMTLIALCCTWKSRAPNIDRCVPRNLTETFDRETADKQANKQMDGQTDGRTLPSALSPCFAKASRSIKKNINGKYS